MENITLNASAAAGEFFEWVYIGIDVLIPHNTGSIITHLHDFNLLALLLKLKEITFYLYRQNKYSESKVKFRQASNHCKRLLQAAKMAYANKIKGSITFQKLDSKDFW